MKKTSDLLLIITGKMPVVRMAMTNISGIKQSTNCMVLANLLAVATDLLRKAQQVANLATASQKQLLPLKQAQVQVQIRKLLLNNLKFSAKKHPLVKADVFCFLNLYTILHHFLFR